jgi:hypothetical protein
MLTPCFDNEIIPYFTKIRPVMRNIDLNPKRNYRGDLVSRPQIGFNTDIPMATHRVAPTICLLAVTLHQIIHRRVQLVVDSLPQMVEVLFDSYIRRNTKVLHVLHVICVPADSRDSH